VTSTILGVRSLEHLKYNLGSVELSLAHEETSRLDTVSDPGKPDYPYGFINDSSGTRS
jgi:aryl-alcohol dehydrogenase-like predicted oxidoreductase